jgi:disulfide bond formation protein DsbB
MSKVYIRIDIIVLVFLGALQDRMENILHHILSLPLLNVGIFLDIEDVRVVNDALLGLLAI